MRRRPPGEQVGVAGRQTVRVLVEELVGEEVQVAGFAGGGGRVEEAEEPGNPVNRTEIGMSGRPVPAAASVVPPNGARLSALLM